MNKPDLQAEGMIFIHSAPTALRSHVEWAVDAAVVAPSFRWTRQPVEPGTWRSEATWRGTAASAAALVSTLAAWGRLRFDLTIESGAPSRRWSVTPDLGVFSAAMDEAGSVLVDEHRLRNAVAQARRGAVLADEIADLLGEPWDVELEAYRACDPQLDVSWLAV
ncbi:DUF3145 family protein [Acidipropionibacterium timonense]|uniref:DUF3145 family protein n=1 Tax=Acidipropionibacterium timonense TaxID=2161818 RepID=UPI001031E9A8|nr:DUF3145 family protein [Acidipropionibacterium timonense]